MSNGSTLGSNHDAVAGLSAELIGEVNSVLSKLMTSINSSDPSLIPLITSLQSSLRVTTQVKPEEPVRKPEIPVKKSTPETVAQQDEALSEFSHYGNQFFDSGTDDKEPLLR